MHTEGLKGQLGTVIPSFRDTPDYRVRLDNMPTDASPKDFLYVCKNGMERVR